MGEPESDTKSEARKLAKKPTETDSGDKQSLNTLSCCNLHPQVHSSLSQQNSPWGSKAPDTDSCILCIGIWLTSLLFSLLFSQPSAPVWFPVDLEGGQTFLVAKTAFLQLPNCPCAPCSWLVVTSLWGDAGVLHPAPATSCSSGWAVTWTG